MVERIPGIVTKFMYIGVRNHEMVVLQVKILIWTNCTWISQHLFSILSTVITELSWGTPVKCLLQGCLHTSRLMEKKCTAFKKIVFVPLPKMSFVLTNNLVFWCTYLGRPIRLSEMKKYLGNWMIFSIYLAK